MRPRPVANEPQGPPATRAEFEACLGARLSTGRWGNAHVFLAESGGERWIVKDFLHCPTPVRQTWGAWMVRRELRALRRLEGIPGVPAGPFSIDRYAFGYRFVEGQALKFVERGRVPLAYFEALEETVRHVHARGIAHLDLRNRGNILVTSDWKPVLIDFQSHLSLGAIPRPMRPFFERIDLSGVYKYWAKIHPESLGPERAALLARAERWRRLWPLRGYAGFKRSRTARGGGSSAIPKSPR